MVSPHPRRPRQSTVRKIKIEIALPSRPADYVPNSGPPLCRLDLLPAADSTAYIDDRILLPPAGLAADGRPLPKRMKYIIGWRDLPAARLLVPAMDVLDYVSPCALEDWEYKMELELDVERARLEAERRALKTQTLHQGPASELPKTKRPGRPPLHHTNIETAVVAEAEDEDGEHTRHRGGAMSLSTPKKRKMDDFLDGYTSDESPTEQLLFDFARSMDKKEADLSKEGVTGIDEAPRVDTAPMAPVTSLAHGGPTAPLAIDDDDRGYGGAKSQLLENPRSSTKMTLPLMSAPARSQSSSILFPPGKGLPRQPNVKPSTPAKAHSSRPITEFLSATRSNGGMLQPDEPQSSSKAPSGLPPDRAQARQQANPKQMSARARKYSGMSDTPSQRAMSKVPSQPQLNETQRRLEDRSKPLSALAKKYSGTAKPTTKSVSSKTLSQPQVDEPQHEPKAKPKQLSALSQKYSGTARPPTKPASSQRPSQSQLDKPPPQPQAKSKQPSALAQERIGTSSAPTPRVSSRGQPEPQLSSSQPRSLAKPKYRSHVAQKKKPTPQARKPTPLKAKKPPPMPIFVDSSSDSDSGSEDEEATWDVDRIEDMELFDVEGEGLVRYFKVRWEGDWPPEQNPTWEPEKNLPEDLVAEFCRTFKPRDGSKSLSEHRHTTHDEDVLSLPVLKGTEESAMEDDAHRPSSAHSGLFVYSSDNDMKKHTWDAPNSQGHRPNLNLVYPAHMA